ncbi:MAG: response regulator transcription factor [Eggerthellaceae bacterium]|nr:response regulator transcription factor [Eggerthellaceae bacterium]
MEIKILVVEDDENILEMTKGFLRKAGFEVDACSNGNEALVKIYDNSYQLAIFDIMLPGTNGHELLREMRRLGDTPVLMMTALGDDTNQLSAFVNEADDYVVKPCSMLVLVKRVEALLRRSGALKKTLSAGRLVLYPESYKAAFDGQPLDFTAKEFDILALLVRNAGKIVTHDALIARIWGFDFEGNEGIVHANIKKLRAKLPVNIIRTVKGVGYCLEDKGAESHSASPSRSTSKAISYNLEDADEKA